MLSHLPASPARTRCVNVKCSQLRPSTPLSFPGEIPGTKTRLAWWIRQRYETLAPARECGATGENPGPPRRWFRTREAVALCPAPGLASGVTWDLRSARGAPTAPRPAVSWALGKQETREACQAPWRSPGNGFGAPTAAIWGSVPVRPLPNPRDRAPRRKPLRKACLCQGQLCSHLSSSRRD